MRYWCRCCDEEAVLAEVPIRLHPFSDPLDVSYCSRCNSEVVEAGICDYCGEPCDPDAEPQLCPECREDFDSLLERVVKDAIWPDHSGPYPRTTMAMLKAEENFLFCLGNVAAVRQDEVASLIRGREYLANKGKAGSHQPADTNNEH